MRVLRYNCPIFSKTKNKCTEKGAKECFPFAHANEQEKNLVNRSRYADWIGRAVSPWYDERCAANTGSSNHTWPMNVCWRTFIDRWKKRELCAANITINTNRIRTTAHNWTMHSLFPQLCAVSVQRDRHTLESLYQMAENYFYSILAAASVWCS